MNTLEVPNIPILAIGLRRRHTTDASYDVSGAQHRASPKVSAMWYVWCALLLSSCALGAAVEPEASTEAVPVATTSEAPRTLDRQASELAWRSWLKSPESGNPSAPPRRIITKSLFITPYVCPKGQRLDRNGCVQMVTVNKDEHERILLEQLNALFTSPPSDVMYDYGDEEAGPLQLSIPIGLDPQAAPLQSHEPAAEAHEQQLNVVKKDENKPNNDASIEAELELLKLQHSKPDNDTASLGVLNHNVLNNFLPYADKPKRDSPAVNETESSQTNTTDLGQKEQVYGHVNIDPVVYGTEYQNQQYDDLPKVTEVTTEQTTESAPILINETIVNNTHVDKNNSVILTLVQNQTKDDVSTEKSDISTNLDEHLTKDKIKLSPESEYSDIGEAIKLISRYAEVTTDDNFAKDQKKYASKDDNVLGTRTKPLQHRRNKPLELAEPPLPIPHVFPQDTKEKPISTGYVPNESYYRYPWTSQHTVTPPPNYPFRHLQDYWPDRRQVGGVYAGVGHENPRRHHHSYPHSYYRPHGLPDASQAGVYLRSEDAAQPQQYPYKAHAGPMRSHNQDLYTLLGLRHWFSSESTSKR